MRILGNAAITDSEEAQALSHYRTNVDIYSNSWGPEDGTGFKKPGTLTLAALKDGVTLVSVKIIVLCCLLFPLKSTFAMKPKLISPTFDHMD